MCPMCGPMMAGMMGWLWLGVLVFVLLVLGVVVLLLWGGRRVRHRVDAPSGLTPTALLQERYARGEISSEEYERVRRDLLPHGRD